MYVKGKSTLNEQMFPVSCFQTQSLRKEGKKKVTFTSS